MRKELKKIAFVIPSLGPGGMERVMSEVIEYITSKDTVECHLVLYGKIREQFYSVPKNVIIHLPDFIFDDSKRLWMTLKTMLFLRKTINKIKSNSILSFGEIWNSLVLLSLFGSKIPIYISDRCQPDKKFGWLQTKLRKLLYPKASGIIAQTTTAKEIYEKGNLNRNIRVIANPIRNIEIPKNNKREKVIISVGRLINTKHFDRLIDIFSQIDISDWKLIIAGGDAIKQKNSITLQDKINKLGLKDRVELAGTQKNVEQYLLQASIFAFTSSSEGFPNVIGEAMSAELPVVAYDCVAGPSDMIEDGKNGFLIPLFDDQLFEEKLRYLMGNEKIAADMGKYAKESIQKFSVTSIGNQFYQFITNE